MFDHNPEQRAKEITRESRASHSLDILMDRSRSALRLNEAMVKYGDVDAFVNLAIRAWQEKDWSLIREALEGVCDKAAEAEVAELTADELLALEAREAQ